MAGGISEGGLYLSNNGDTISEKMGELTIGAGIGYGNIVEPEGPGSDTENLLLEDELRYLLESGDFILLESST